MKKDITYTYKTTESLVIPVHDGYGTILVMRGANLDALNKYHVIEEGLFCLGHFQLTLSEIVKKYGVTLPVEFAYDYLSEHV